MFTEYQKENADFNEETIELLPYPVYLLNEKRIFVARNKGAQPSHFLPYRLRSSLDNYITIHDKRRVLKMNAGDELFIYSFSFGAYGMIIRKQNVGYVLAIRHITTQMATHVSNLMIQLPSFFADSERSITNLRMSTFQDPEEMKRVRSKYNRALRFQTELAVYFRVTSGKIQNDVDAEVGLQIKSLIEAAQKLLMPNGYRLKMNLHSSAVYCIASAEDLAYCVATMIAVAAEHICGYTIYAETNVLNNYFHISVTFEPYFDEETYKGVLKQNYSGSMLESKERNMFFDLLMIQMLCEANNWQFKINNPSGDSGILNMTISVPQCPVKPYFFNEPMEVLTLLEMCFAELMIKYDKLSEGFESED